MEGKNTINKKSEVKEWVQSISFAIIVAFVIKFFIFDFAYVDGQSMYPTLDGGDRLIVSKFTYFLNEPDYGDIVILHYKQNVEYVKRVIGKSGDSLEIVDNVVYRNGKALTESYINDEPYPDFPLTTVPDNSYFVMGDNRAHSSDSRSPSLGFVNRSAIIGKVVFRMLPLSHAGKL